MLKETELEPQEVSPTLGSLVQLLQIFVGGLAAGSIIISLIFLQLYAAAYHARWLLPFLVDSSFKLIFFVFFELCFIIALPLFTGTYMWFAIKNSHKNSKNYDSEIDKIFSIKNTPIFLLLIFVFVLTAYFSVGKFGFIGIILIILTNSLVIIYHFSPEKFPIPNKTTIAYGKKIPEFLLMLPMRLMSYPVSLLVFCLYIYYF